MNSTSYPLSDAWMRFHNVLPPVRSVRRNPGFDLLFLGKASCPSTQYPLCISPEWLLIKSVWNILCIHRCKCVFRERHQAWSLFFSKRSIRSILVSPTSRLRKHMTQNARQSATPIFCFFHRHVFSPIVSFAVDQKMNFCWCLCFCSGALGSCFDAVSQMKYNSLCARVKSVCLPRYNCCKDCTTAAISQLNINDARVSSMSNDTYVQPLC